MQIGLDNEFQISITPERKRISYCQV